jgi:hypothetical protein
MKTEIISLESLCDILEESTITETLNAGGMLCHAVNHPTIGKAQTIQSGSDCLLIKSL